MFGASNVGSGDESKPIIQTRGRYGHICDVVGFPEDLLVFHHHHRAEVNWTVVQL